MLVACWLAACGPAAVFAANGEWLGTTDALWSTTTNWSASPVPGSGDTATFNGAGNGNTTLDLGGGVTVRTLSFTGASAAAYTIGSGGAGSQSLTLSGGGGITLANTITTDQLVDANLVLGVATTAEAFTFTNNDADNLLTVAGGISSALAGAKTLTVTGAGETRLNGTIGNGSGTVALTKTGTGLLRLGAANTFTGATNLSGGGTIRATANDAFAGNVAIASGLVDLDGFSTAVGTGSGHAIYFAATSGPPSSVTSEFRTGSGTVTLNGNIRVDSDAKSTNIISGKLSLGAATREFSNASYGTSGSALMVPTIVRANVSGGSGVGLTVSNSGEMAALILSGANTYAGSTTINNNAVVQLGEGGTTGSLSTSSTIVFGGSGSTLLFRRSNTVTQGIDFTAAISGSGRITQGGTGTLVLNGANTYSGITTVRSGTLQVGANNSLSDSSAITVAGNAAGVTATLDLNDFTDTIPSLTLGGATTTSGASVITGAGTLTLGGGLTFDATNNPLGATVTGGLALGTASRTFTVGDSSSAATDLTVSAGISGGTGGALIKAGAGTMLLSGDASYTGTTTVNAGTLALSGDNAAAVGDVTVNAGGVLRFDTTTAINGGAFDALNQDVTVNVGAAVVFGNAFGSGIADVQTALANRIAAGSAGAIAANGYEAANFDFAAAGLTNASLGAVGSLTYTGTLTPNGTTYRLGSPLGTLTLANSDALTGARSVVITGNVVLPVANDYDGGTTLSAGTLQIGSAAGLGSGGITFNGGGISSDGGTPRTFAADVAFTGNGTVGDATNTGKLTFTGPVSLGGATRTLTVASETQFDGVFSASGSFGLTKAGNATLTLGGASTYTGPTTVNAGVLAVASLADGGQPSPIGQSSAAVGNLVLGGGTLRYSGATRAIDRGFSITAGTTGTIDVSDAAATLTLPGATGTATTGGLTKAGNGSLVLSAAQTNTGTTTVTAGSLVLAGGSNTLRANSPLVVNGGSLSLGAGNQYVGQFSGSGGAVTGTGGTFTVRPTGSATFAGALGGSLSLLKVAPQTLTLTGDSDTTGQVAIYGGNSPGANGAVLTGITLSDGGRLSGASSLAIYNGTLALNDNGTTGLADRVRDAAPITLAGGRIAYTGRNNVASSESLGGVTVGAGQSVFVVNKTGSASAVVTLASLARNSGAVLAVTGTGLGQSGNNPRLLVTGALSGNLAAVNSVIPGVWNAAGGLVGYVAGQGFGTFGTTGFPAYATGTLATAASTANFSGGGAVAGGGQTINALAMSSAVTFASDDDTLTIGSGMVVQGTEAGRTFGSDTGIRGKLTSGLSTGELFLLKANGGSGGTDGGYKINSVITDNGATRVRLVLGTNERTDLSNQRPNLTANNTHTGGTVVMGGAEVYLTATTAGWTTVPAADDPGRGLVIDNSTVTMRTNAQQIAATNIVTLNGGSILTLTGADNRLAGIVFNSTGGRNQNPTVQSGTKLTVTGNISSTPFDPSVTPTISVPVDLDGSTAHDVTVAPLPQGNFITGVGALNGLQISSAISNGGFTKKGGGVLNLTGTNTFAGQLTVEEGVLNVATINNASANGPLGNSALPVILGGAGGKTGILEYTGGTGSPTKTFTMATGGRGGFQVDNAGTTLTLSTDVAGSGGMVKYGPGTLALSSAANSYAGATVVAAGTLSLTASGSANNISFSPLIDVQRGATLNVTGLSGSDDLVVDLSQTIGGTGTVLGNMTLRNGATLSPGASPGILSQTGDQVWGAFGNYNWQMHDATGAAGIGYDRMDISGTLTIEPFFDFNLWSLSAVGPDTNGPALNFNPAADGYWVVATAAGGLVNPSNLSQANLFTTGNNGTGGFTNSFPGTFSLAQGNGTIGTTNDVVLVYTVPEPAGLAGLGAGLLLLLAAGRRRWCR